MYESAVSHVSAMSGVGEKAGGPDYVRQFMQPRIVTENMMRHGFAPDTGPAMPP